MPFLEAGFPVILQGTLKSKGVTSSDFVLSLPHESRV